MDLDITSLYAGLSGLLLMTLSMRIAMMRRRLAVGIGSGNHQSLELAMRVHGNFIEYVPLALLLLALRETGGAQAAGLHAAGVCLIAGRILHAVGLGGNAGRSFGRITGILLTWGLITVLSIAEIIDFFS